MQTDDRSYISYRVDGLPTGPFGETYAIVAAVMDRDRGETHRYEYFIVSKRHAPNLVAEGIDFPAGLIPKELLIVDEDFLLTEAKQRAENYLNEALYKLAEKHGDHVLASYRVDLRELRNMPLLGLWMRGELHEQIKAVAAQTRCPRLKLALAMVTQSPVLRRGG